MSDEEIKTKIQELADAKYNGKYQKFKPKMLKKLIGEDGYNKIYTTVSSDMHHSCSLTVLCFMRDIHKNPKCTCGNNTKFNTTTRLFMQYCSNKCKWDNNDKVQEVKRATNLKIYGHINVLGNDAIKKKILNSNIEKYGVENYTQTKEYQLWAKGRSSATTDSIKRVSEGIRKNHYNSFSTKYTHCKPLFTLEEYDGVKGYKQYPWECNECGKEFQSSFDNGSSPVCGFCKPAGTDIEIAVRKFLDYHDIKYVFRYRGLPSKREIDFYIPEKNLGIEIHGLYWHCTASPSYGKNDHISKSDECEEQGIKLIDIYADEIYHKFDIVKNRLKSALGLVKRKIYARKCEVKCLDNKIVKSFLNKYHIQGNTVSLFRYGLYYKNRLVSLMTFNTGRKVTGNISKVGVYEIGRYVTVSNFSVLGGAGKLLAHFIRNNSPSEVYSYADRRWSDGNLYEKLGMTLIKKTIPNYWYTKDFKSRIHRFHFQKSKLINMPSYSIDKTEECIMREEKYFKTWDCGSLLFQLKL